MVFACGLGAWCTRAFELPPKNGGPAPRDRKIILFNCTPRLHQTVFVASPQTRLLLGRRRGEAARVSPLPGGFSKQGKVGPEPQTPAVSLRSCRLSPKKGCPRRAAAASPARREAAGKPRGARGEPAEKHSERWPRGAALARLGSGPCSPGQEKIRDCRVRKIPGRSPWPPRVS